MQIIRQTREKLKLTQAELGQYLGVAGNTVARWERQISSPEYPEMLELALLGLEIKLRNVKTREKIRKIETEVRQIHSRIDKGLREMNA
jgi:transcriptional regulator with XRE-family HTH domain